MEASFQKQREQLVAHKLRGAGIEDERVLTAMARLPREQFVPEVHRARAYEDRPLPIGYDQTISQPYIVALMLQLLRLKGDERVLDVGTGSGYQAALLGHLAREVYSIEIIPELATRAQRVLDGLGLTNVRVAVGDGNRGWPEAAPFDAIVVAAAAGEVPAVLLSQLAEGGRLVLPIGDASGQELVAIQRNQGRFEVQSAGACLFVPLVEAPRQVISG